MILTKMQTKISTFLVARILENPTQPNGSLKQKRKNDDYENEKPYQM